MNALVYFYFIVLLSSLATAYDLRTHQCTPWFGKWPCWWAQACGSELNTCTGGAADTPPFTAIAYGWIVFGGIVGCLVGLAILAGIGVGLFFLFRRVRACCAQ